MAVPARPVPGNPIADDWGDVAHDTAVAMDIQSGFVQTGNGTSGPVGQQATVTFPRPFAAPPVCVLASNNFNAFAGFNGNNPTATGFTCATNRPGANSGAGYGVLWVCYGPRA